jgi:hypothetical protein
MQIIFIKSKLILCSFAKKTMQLGKTPFIILGVLYYTIDSIKSVYLMEEQNINVCQECFIIIPLQFYRFFLQFCILLDFRCENL